MAPSRVAAELDRYPGDEALLIAFYRDHDPELRADERMGRWMALYANFKGWDDAEAATFFPAVALPEPEMSDEEKELALVMYMTACGATW